VREKEAEIKHVFSAISSLSLSFHNLVLTPA